jgi:hypothetical protein
VTQKPQVHRLPGTGSRIRISRYQRQKTPDTAKGDVFQDFTNNNNEEEIMAQRRFFMLAVCLVLSAVCVTGAFAQITVSGGLALSSLASVKETGNFGINPSHSVDSSIGVGGNVFVDYLLPIGIPLSLGGEIGVDGAKVTIDHYGEETITAIPLLLRAAYHFDLAPKLDLYAVAKIGYVFGAWKGDNKNWLEASGVTVGAIGGFGFGFDAGVAYYFNSKVGAFAEVGFDDYMLKSKLSSGGYTGSLKAPFHRFLTAGVSVKF